MSKVALVTGGSLFEATDDELQNGLQINLVGAIHCMREFVPGMIETKHERIVNVTSGWGHLLLSSAESIVLLFIA